MREYSNQLGLALGRSPDRADAMVWAVTVLIDDAKRDAAREEVMNLSKVEYGQAG